MLKTTIEIDGKPVVFKASAAIPRIYRIKFRRDIYKDDYDVPDKGIDGYNELIAQYANIEKDYEALKERLFKYNDQCRLYRNLRTELNKRHDKIKEFDAKDWSMFVERVTVGVDGSMTFFFKGDVEIKV